jgi:2'-5' RNA ligase
MAIAINIRADDSSANEVERLWDQVAAFEDEPSMRALGYRPHFTFAIYDSPEIEEKTAWEAMLRAVRDEAQLRIEFRRIRWFVGPPLVPWAEPAADETLTRWHASISAATDPADCRPHYRHRPGAWTPHCTLGTSTEQLQCCLTWWIALFSRPCGWLPSGGCRRAFRKCVRAPFCRRRSLL